MAAAGQAPGAGAWTDFPLLLGAYTLLGVDAFCYVRGLADVREEDAMIDHIGLRVRDLEASKRFYQAALSPLGYSVLKEFPGAVGLGKDGKPDFWIGAGGAPGGAVHVAFTTADRATVDAFHAAAIAAGGKDNGAPGLRTMYHPTYYGAFVLDPDGNNVEAVCHTG